MVILSQGPQIISSLNSSVGRVANIVTELGLYFVQTAEVLD